MASFMKNRGGKLPIIGAWAIAFLIISVILISTNYRSRDPDSALYSDMAAKMGTLPLKDFIAPQWWGLWNNQGLFREHPIGFFIVPVLFIKLGLPANQACYLVNALYQILSLLLIYKLAQPFCAAMEARSLLWIIQLLPISFAYRIRANHEQAVLLCLLLALFGIERVRNRLSWVLCVASALFGLMLIKGLFVFFGIAICFFWAIFRTPEINQKSRLKPIWAMIVVIIFLGVVVVAYESIYFHTTGESFLKVYVGKWVGLGIGQHGSFLVNRMYHLVWYLARILWFACPWSFLFLGLLWKYRKSLGRWFFSFRNSVQNMALEGFVLSLGVVAIYVFVLSLSSHKADRYIFPAHFFTAAVGIVASLRIWPKWRCFVEKLDNHFAFFPALVWMLCCFSSLVGSLLHLPWVKIWTK